MTKLERAKIAALNQHVRIPDWGYGATLLKNLRWRVEHDPQAPLSSQEQYLLEQCCWHYRRKLGGLVAFPLPDAPPERATYFPHRDDGQESFL